MPGHIRFRARGRPGRRRKTSSQPNRLETAYAARLEARQLAGEIAGYRFERIKLRLADATYYTPDFVVYLADGAIEFHEVKGGHWEDDARVKIKVASEQYPEFVFLAVTRHGGTWKIEDFG